MAKKIPSTKSKTTTKTVKKPVKKVATKPVKESKKVVAKKPEKTTKGLGKKASDAVVTKHIQVSGGGLEEGRRKKIRELVMKGMSSGYVSQSDILNLFPDAEEYVAELDDLYDELILKEIDVYENVAEDVETGESREMSDL